MFVDLHMHTMFSDDSTVGVGSAFDRAAEIGLAAIGITDHDTTAGFLDAKDAALRTGVSFIPGVEVSSSFSGHMVHLLVYTDRIDQPRIQRFLDHDVFTAKRRYLLPVLQALHGAGFPVSADGFDKEVRLHGKGGAPMLRYLERQGILDDFSKYDKFISGFLPDGFECPDWAPPVEECISIAHICKAAAILAHPCDSGLCSEEKLNQLREMGIDGLEIYYPSHTNEQQERLRKYAEKHGLLITGGSDYHGLETQTMGKPGLELIDRHLLPVLHLQDLLKPGEFTIMG